MALTKEQFVAEVKKLCAEGKTVTDELFTNLSNLIVEFAESQSSTTGTTGTQTLDVELVGIAKTNAGTKWETVTAVVADTPTGKVVKIDGGVRFGTYLREIDVSKTIPLNSATTVTDAVVTHSISGHRVTQSVKTRAFPNVNGAKPVAVTEIPAGTVLRKEGGDLYSFTHGNTNWAYAGATTGKVYIWTRKISDGTLDQASKNETGGVIEITQVQYVPNPSGAVLN